MVANMTGIFPIEYYYPDGFGELNKTNPSQTQ